MPVFIAEYPIHTYETDANGMATFGAIFGFLQDSAAAQATKIGYGLDDMKRNETLWVLSRFLYRARRIPRWQEVLRISTWPSGTEALYALRDWQVNDEAGQEVAIATSSWVVINIEKRSPVRIERIAERMDMIIDRRLFERTAAKIPTLEQAGPRYGVQATFADMDLNGHVNSTRYVEWMFDALPAGFREDGNELVEIEVNFNGESHAGDELDIYRVETRPAPPTGVSEPEPALREFLHNAVKRSDASVVCRARSVWRGKR